MKMKTVALIGVVAAIVLAIVITVVATSSSSSTSEPKRAVVVFNVGAKASGVGKLELTQDAEEGPVRIKGTLKGLSPGKHGFHVHDKGDVSGGCGSTAGHFNPHKKLHGAPEDTERHVGDLGNILVNADGEVDVDIQDKHVSLLGELSIIGRAMVIHEGEDDLGKGGHNDSLTTGHAGGRFTCGIIGIA